MSCCHTQSVAKYTQIAAANSMAIAALHHFRVHLALSLVNNNNNNNNHYRHHLDVGLQQVVL